MPYRVHVIDHPALWGWWLLPLLVFAVILAVAAYATVRLVDRGGAHRPAAPPYPPGPPAPDQAVVQARFRYASGQLSREEYLRILADLGAAPPGPPPWPSAPNPPMGAGAPAGATSGPGASGLPGPGAPAPPAA